MQNPSSDETRRHRDGSIDFGFYRDQAACLRRQRRNAVARQLGASLRRWAQSGAWAVATLVRTTRAIDRRARAPKAIAIGDKSVEIAKANGVPFEANVRSRRR